jgi:hypothetical protein
MPSGVDIFGVLTGAVGLIGTIFSIWQLVNPWQLLRTLDKSLRSCERLLASECEEGILSPDMEYSVRERLFV